MDLQRAKQLVAQGESKTIEFKRKVAHPDKIVKELVAFANTAGGYLFIGVDDDGSIPGLKFPEDEVFAMDEAIKKYCHPIPKYKQEIVPISSKKSLVVYHIPSGQNKLHYLRQNQHMKHGMAFVRVDDESVKASKEVKEIFRRRWTNRNIQFNFGDKEKFLMEYLQEHDNITLKEFRKLAQLNYYKASKTLIILVLANILTVTPSGKRDIYRLKNNY
ncbi:ATP-binding protein [Fulvivirga sp. M361]|uniref:AlbA family DNA-binding domain-containing protein n=1 Tax=Fulvivirga sp. M361 TaxID=2594266 RepID=UPI001179A9AB|nr:ATP-binding protein [Fulvivirga sp. M361]TRX49818.1 ATP-binding protein [Fulvivirga sp. M361]